MKKTLLKFITESIRIGKLLLIKSISLFAVFLIEENLIAQSTVVTTFSANNTFAVPVGVSKIKVEAWGGGGGGGGCNSVVGGSSGSGGGGGAYNLLANFSVTSGQVYNINIGSGGTVSSDANGGAGGASTFTGPQPGSTVLLTANGGGGGGRRQGAQGTAGTGGVYNGGIGGQGSTTNSGGGGGGGGNNGSGGTTAGGAGSPNSAPYKGGTGGASRGLGNGGNGNAGTIPGGGGGGGFQSLFNGAKSGGVGASGQIVVSYTYTPVFSSLGASSGCVGSTVVINGNYLDVLTAVSFNGTAATWVVNSATQITATIPNATAGVISLTSAGGSVNTTTFTPIAQPASPVVTLNSNSPKCATPGVTINTISGSPSIGETWYWQSTVNGNSTSLGSASSLTTGTSGTYYLSSFNGTCWSNTSATSITVTTVPSVPNCITNPSVANTATNVCFSGTGALTTLSWTAATGNPSSYDVYFGAGSLPGLPNGNVTSTSWTISGITLFANTTYYWKIVPKNDCGDATGCTTYSFTTAPIPCYCSPTYSSGGTTDNITNVTLGTLNDATPANVNPYYFNRIAVQNAVPVIQRGTVVNIAVTMGTNSTQFSRVWIDFNQNGVLEVAESFSLGTNAGASGTSVIPITIPVTAVLGNTLLRVRGGDDVAITSAQACGASSSTWGQALDYLVNISCPTTAGTASTSYSSCLPNVTFTGFGGTTIWQGSADNVTFNDIAGANGTTYVIPSNSPYSYWRVKGTISGCSDVFTTSTFAMPSTYTGTSNIIVNDNITLSGTYNLGTNNFTLSAGKTITLVQGCPLTIYANDITINGTIDGNGKGADGGSGGAAAGASLQDGGGNTNSRTRGGSGGGVSSVVNGRGIAGSNGQDGVDNNSNVLGTGVNIVTGGGGGGAGAGGGYGGTGGTSSLDTWTNTSDGVGGNISGNLWGASLSTCPTIGGRSCPGAIGSASSNSFDLTNDVDMGGGGAGGGGGGGSRDAGGITSGGNGGNGGGAVKLYFTGAFTMPSGSAISMNGLPGGAGGRGANYVDAISTCTGSVWGAGGGGGGAGGGAGGGILIYANACTSTINIASGSQLSAIGGNGGIGGAAGNNVSCSSTPPKTGKGGGGGGGGRIKIYKSSCGSYSNSASTSIVAGLIGSGTAVTSATDGTNTVTSLYNLVAGAITSSDQTYCNNGNPSVITASPSTGGTCAYSYQWYVTKTACGSPTIGTSASAASGWVAVSSSAATADLSSAGILQGLNDLGGLGDFCFQRRTSSGSCYAWTNTVKVTRYDRPTSTWTGPATLCSNVTDSMFITFTGSTPFTFTYKIGAISYTVSGYNANVFGFPITLLTSTNFEVVSLSDVNCTALSGDLGGVKTVVVPSSCISTWLGATSTDWGNALNWSPSFTPNSCAIDIVIPSGTPYSPTISGTNYSVGNVAIASGVILTLAGKDLSVCGNWNAGVGTDAVTIGSGTTIFQGGNAHSIIGNTTFNNLTLNDALGAAITSGGTVDITGILSLQTGILNSSSGTLTFKSTSASQSATIDHFSSGFNGSIVGTIYAERFVPVGGSNQHYISSPIDNLSLSQFGANGVSGYVIPTANCDETQLQSGSPYGSVFEFHEDHAGTCSLKGWEVKTSGLADNARGYSAYLTGLTQLVVNGNAQLSNNVTLGNLTNSGWANHSTLQGRIQSSGWNLIGNPYLANLNLTSHLGFDNQVQVWVTSGPYAGTYQASMMGASAFIAPFQGFMVHKTNIGSDIFTISKTECSNNPQQFYKTNESELEIALSGNGFNDKTIIQFNEDASISFDPLFDANKIHSKLGQPTLFTLEASNAHLSINTNPSIINSTSIPLSLEPGSTSQYTLTFNKIATFDPSQYIFLEDKKIGGNWLNMRDNRNYVFNAAVNDDWNRFAVHFTPAIKVNTLNATCTSLGQVNIVQSGNVSWNYSLNDQNNTVIYSGIVNSANPQYLNVQSGNYTLQCTDANNYSFTRQIQVGGSIGISSVLSADKSILVSGESVTFNAIANGASNYAWDFGDGTTITGNATQMHTYQNEGIYTAIVTATSASGCITSSSQVITVTEPNTTSNIDVNVFGANIFSFENRVVIDFSKQKNVNTTVQIYNVLGQEIATDKFTSSTIYTKEINSIEPAYVLVRVTNSDGKMYTRKLLVSNKK